MKKILIVDDAEINREILAEIFEEQFEILQAGDGEEAIDVIDKRSDDISLILLDLMMPKKNGLEVLAHMRHRDMLEHIPVIMITGEATAESDLKAYEYGAADIIYKPFVPKVVIRRAMNLMELYEKREDIEHKLSERTEELKKSEERIANTNKFLLEALGSVVEFRSLESGEHVKRVRDFTRIMLGYVRSRFPQYHLTKEQIKLMSDAAVLHDIGKIAIPDNILNAPRRLTKEEFDVMKTHTTQGCEILEKFKFEEDSEFYKYCYEICRWHHEKTDGKGYPDGLKGDEIPIYCQAVAIADCFDALVSKRVYKSQVSCQESYDMIINGECGQFSDTILTCFALAKDEMFKVVKESGGDCDIIK